MRPALLTIAALFVCAVAEAHVRIIPAESKAGTTETYSARGPTEDKVTTASVELDVPDGVVIVSASAPSGATYELKKDGNRIIAVVWTTAIKPGDSAMLSFVARNPKAGGDRAKEAHALRKVGRSGRGTVATVTRPGSPPHH
jgi:uncharacterized protein YcnI